MGVSTIVVCGTGTEVGKTHVACCLLAELRRRGEDAVGLKPVESGVAGALVSDANRLAIASGGAEVGSLYGFGEAVSPHLAARRAGVTIDVAAITEWVEELRGGVAVVETAGGLMTPLGPGVCNLDLVPALDPEVVVLVGQDALGVLNGVGLARSALRMAGFWRASVVALSAPVVPDASSESNVEELLTLGVVERCVAFPRAAEDAEVSRCAARTLVALVEAVAHEGCGGRV